MQYNEAKRNLEKAAGILGVITSALFLVGFLAMFILGCMSVAVTETVESSNAYGYVVDYYQETSIDMAGLVMIIVGLLLAILSIVRLVYCAKIIKSPVLPNGQLLNTQKARICAVVFSFICGELITAGLVIAVLCLKDFTDQVAPMPVTQNMVATPDLPKHDVQPKPVAEHAILAKPENPKYNLGLDEKIAELNKLESLGLIDAASYNKAIDRLFSNLK